MSATTSAGARFDLLPVTLVVGAVRAASHAAAGPHAALLSQIVAINAWNTIVVTSRAWVPGSYQPGLACPG